MHCTQKIERSSKEYVLPLYGSIHLPQGLHSRKALLSSTSRSPNILASIGMLAIGAFLLCGTAAFAAGTNLSSQGSILTNKPAIILTRSTSPAELAKLGSNDIVQLQSGRQLKMGTIRKFSSLSRKLKAARPTYPAMPISVRKPPAATGLKVMSMSDLSSKLEASPEEATIQFPSGRTYTVAQLRFLKPFLEVQLGRKIKQPGVQSQYQGTAIKLSNTTDKKYWKSIFSKSDDTVLETPQGKRFTVGELKSFIGQGNLSRVTSTQNSGGKK